MLGFALATEGLAGPAASSVFRHCVNVLRPKSGSEGENLQAVHTDAVSVWYQSVSGHILLDSVLAERRISCFEAACLLA